MDGKFEPIPIVIPSMSRADRVITLKLLPPGTCIICVPESQKADYEKYNPSAQVVAHPDSVKGIARKRQWIYEKWRDVFMIDDDQEKVVEHITAKNRKLTPDEVYDWIQQTYSICKQLDIKFFGFKQDGIPTTYKSHKPIFLSGHINAGAFGTLWDERLSFCHPDLVANEDHYISALNAYYNRKAWIDNRIFFSDNTTFKNPGGLAHFRTKGMEGNDSIVLRRLFGETIRRKVDTALAKRKIEHQVNFYPPF